MHREGDPADIPPGLAALPGEADRLEALALNLADFCEAATLQALAARTREYARLFALYPDLDPE